MNPKSILGSLGVFSLVFVFLMIPTSPIASAYLGVFRSIGAWVFFSEWGEREVLFQKSPRSGQNSAFTRIEIANRRKLAPDGSGTVRHVDFDAGRLAWLPTAFFIALVLASPLQWPRRLRALALGGVCVQVVVFLCLAFVIWRESSVVGLVSLTPFWADIAARSQSGFLTLLPFLYPVVIWVAVVFRREDFSPAAI